MQKPIRYTNSQIVSGFITLGIGLVAITPLCGFLFQCGCDWPWAGLDAGCNFYQSESRHHCPWCASMATGIVSTGLAIGGGALTAVWFAVPESVVRFNSVARRVLSGMAVFLVLALLSALIAALWQGYGLGVGVLLFG